MNYYLFFILIASVLGASLYLGYRSSKGIKTEIDYFLSGRKLSFFQLTMTLLATQLGGGAIIGAAESAYNYGWVALSYSFGLALGLIALSLGIGSKFRTMNIRTLPQIFSDIYGSEVLRILSSIIYMISMFLILVALGVSARKFALSVGFNNELIFITFWLIVIIYTTTGGLSAVTNTDILQVIFVLLAFMITLAFLLPNNNITLSKATFTLSKEAPWVSWFFMPCFFAIVGQDMAQRCFAAKSPRSISFATFFAALLLIASSVLPVYLGILAKGQGYEAIKGSSVLINVISTLTNPYVASFFSCSILMAILSTADSQLCAIGANAAMDFSKFFKSNTNVNFTRLSKIITFLVGILSLLVSYLAKDVIATMVLAYNISIVALFVPIIMAVMLKNPPKLSALMSSFGGMGSFLFLEIFFEYKYPELMALGVSFVLFFAAYPIGRRLALQRNC